MLSILNAQSVGLIWSPRTIYFWTPLKYWICHLYSSHFITSLNAQSIGVILSQMKISISMHQYNILYVISNTGTVPIFWIDLGAHAVNSKMYMISEEFKANKEIVGCKWLYFAVWLSLWPNGLPLLVFQGLCIQGTPPLMYELALLLLTIKVTSLLNVNHIKT